jgi:fused signal recognition particle receptor
MDFFSKLRNGLSKTKKDFSDKINSVFSVFTKVDEELFEELEEILIMSDVGYDTTLFVLDELRDRIKKKRIEDSQEVKNELITLITEILLQNSSEIKLNTKPSIIIVIGVNGVGKTTSIGKIASYYKNSGKEIILAAADTFRAAAAEQLEIWASRSGCNIIRHQEGADPSAVVFDAISSAKSKKADLIICDTAGRLHNKKNLMNELEKIIRTVDRELPDADKEVLLVLDATTGQNAISQAKLFDEATGLTGLILTKLDGTAKGGVVIGLSQSQKLPVRFVGVGEQIDDLQPFNAEEFAKALFE